MAMDNSELESLFNKYLKEEGFNLDNEHCVTSKMTRAFSKAMVEHIQAKAEVHVLSGSSKGTYKVT